MRRPRTVGEKLVVGISLGGLGLFLGLPLAVLVERSLAVGGGYRLDAYRGSRATTSVLLAAPWEAIVNSIVYASAATVIALVVGGLAAFAVAGTRGRLLDGVFLLPLGASAVMLGLGFLIAFDTVPIDFRAAPWIVPVAQALVAIPFVVRIVVPTLRSIDERQREAAALLGASPARVLRGDRPADRLARPRGRCRLRLRDLTRRVRRDGLPRAARPADSSGRDLPLPRPPGRAERRTGLRARGRAHGRDGRVRARRRAGTRASRQWF